MKPRKLSEIVSGDALDAAEEMANSAADPGTKKAAAELVELAGSYRMLYGKAKAAKKLDDPEVAPTLRGVAEKIKAQDEYLRQPNAPKSLGAGDDGPRSFGGNAGQENGSPKILAPEQKVANPADGSPYGGLGVLAKSLVTPVDQAEIQRFLPELERKDMLSSGGGGVLVPAPIAGFVIDLLRARTVTIGLGARTVPMSSATLAVPRVTQDPTPTWENEGATVTPSDGDLEALTLTARRLTAIVKFSEELDEDSDPELAGQVLAGSLASAFAVEIDRVALRGSGTPPEPAGILNQTGVTIVPTVGAADWSTLAGFKRDLEAANSEATGFILSPRTSNAVETEAGTDGHFVAPPSSIADIPRRITSAVPVNLGVGSDESEIYAGKFEDLYIGMRIQFTLRRLDQRYAEEGKIALAASMRADIGLAHAASFVVGTGVLN